jgi:hypothetical protein
MSEHDQKAEEDAASEDLEVNEEADEVVGGLSNHSNTDRAGQYA